MCRSLNLRTTRRCKDETISSRNVKKEVLERLPSLLMLALSGVIVSKLICYINAIHPVIVQVNEGRNS